MGERFCWKKCFIRLRIFQERFIPWDRCSRTADSRCWRRRCNGMNLARLRFLGIVFFRGVNLGEFDMKMKVFFDFQSTEISTESFMVPVLVICLKSRYEKFPGLCILDYQNLRNRTYMHLFLTFSYFFSAHRTIIPQVVLLRPFHQIE